ncbi:phosphoribosylanthranilate isomerase [Paenibacillus sp. sptzw28]|uniref:phosphoribosylanthranilate isomerase n=1 Tax=Paenibacillus sp. sptzw28 TaxID=715179 RepID=UPI001C6F5147|nr:phosphoribosylanthranilate isomerase [Paenibacillus sp. sptzw28]QYR19895.1 phosphoribosylanthranilate isomerase [Paenibacillus sp. sptzw28]
MNSEAARSSGTRVKICGLRDAGTIRAMDGLPVDEIGFMFANSKRRVSPELAGRLIGEVRSLQTPDGLSPRAVGVFVGATLEQLRELLAVAPLDVVQLHGEESADLCAAIRKELGVEVWKVFPVTGLPSDGPSRLFPYLGAVDAVLIDTAGGGTGRPFAWDEINSYKEAAKQIGVPLYVAGGLHPGNIGELLDVYTPDGVDVSSGVETDGVKDTEKIRLFVERVKLHESSAGQ